jgi:predicted AlkP superfamily phosphohydrolase/phosphomutase
MLEVRPVTNTLLIGLDGATFTIVEPLMENGVMPFLKNFIASGVRGQILSTSPPVTPPAWTSIMTGCNPGRHGLIDFVRCEERGGEMYFTLYNGRDIQCETIWSIACRHNKRAIALNFPMTYPHPPISGYIVPGLVSWKYLKMAVQPQELYEKLKAIPGFSYKAMAWDWEKGKKVVYGVDPEEYESWVRLQIERERNWFEAAKYLMRNDPCELTAMLWDGPDKLMHICWRFLDPAWLPENPTPWETKIRELCLDYFRRVDTYLEELVTLAGLEARTFIVSDHGFGPSTEILYINVWLEEQGYLRWRATPSDVSGENWKRRLRSNFVLLDWEKTTAYAPTSSRNGIHIRTAQGPGSSGVPIRDYESFRNQLIDKIYGIVDPQTGERIVKRVLKREETHLGAQRNQAPDLTLELRDYGFVSIRNSPPALQIRPEVTGTHQPNGVFLANGTGIRNGADITPISVLDVAGILLHSLGLPVPHDLEGVVPEQMFESSWMETNPVRIGGATHFPKMTSESQPEDDIIFERLKNLGYVE